MRRFYYTAAGGRFYGSVRRIRVQTHRPKWYKNKENRGQIIGGGGMGRPADKIAHLGKTAFKHPEYIRPLLPLAGKEGYERGK